MEFTLVNTNILDPSLAEKFDSFLKNDLPQMEPKVYRFIINFHVDILFHRTGINNFALPPSGRTNHQKKNDDKEKMYDVLRFQLKAMVSTLEKYDVEFYSSIIQGDQLDSLDIVKIEFIEDKWEEKYDKKGRIIARNKVSTVMPSKIYTTNLVNKLAGERLSEIYNRFYKAIPNKKMMSEILEIEPTENENELFQAFVRQYWGMWLTTNEKEKEYVDKFANKAVAVIERYEKEGVKEFKVDI